jgi:hypothetical protein
LKCVVLDLDNTLWGGIVGDDGVVESSFRRMVTARLSIVSSRSFWGSRRQAFCSAYAGRMNTPQLSPQTV